MQIGIVGLPYTGKTTVFNALTGLSAPTGQYIDGQGDIHRGVVHVPDERLERLARRSRGPVGLRAELGTPDRGANPG